MIFVLEYIYVSCVTVISFEKSYMQSGENVSSMEH